MKKKCYLSVVFLFVSLLIFLGIILLSSPYRMLRPYTLTSGEKLLSGLEYRPSEHGTHWQVRIPALPQSEWEDFYIDQIPITVRDYKKCVSEGACTPPHYIEPYTKYYENPIYGIFPMTFVSVWEAETYCEAHGGTLPTEMQWEAAAGLAFDQTYPWGNEEPDLSRANYEGYYQGITPAGWLPNGVSPYGILDLAGNVREWTVSYDPSFKEYAPLQDLRAPEAFLKDYEDEAIFGRDRILKGGGAQDFQSDLELSAFMIHAPYSPGFNRGFRCVYPVGKDLQK